MELRFKVNGYADWEARQHATNIIHKISWKEIDTSKDVGEQTKSLVDANTSQKFKDVIPTRFKFYWIAKDGKERAVEQTPSSADNTAEQTSEGGEEAPVITDETTTDIQKELSTGQKVPPRPTVKVPPKKKK